MVEEQTHPYTVAIALLPYNGSDIDLPIVINNFNGNTPIYDNSGTDDIDTTASTLIDVQGFNYGSANSVYLIVNNCLSFLYKATIEKTDRSDFATYAFGTFSSNVLTGTDRIVLNDNNIQPV